MVQPEPRLPDECPAVSGPAVRGMAKTPKERPRDRRECDRKSAQRPQPGRGPPRDPLCPLRQATLGEASANSPFRSRACAQGLRAFKVMNAA